MTEDPKLVAGFFTYSPADVAVLEEQAAEQLYLAKKTRWKYRHELQQVLRDADVLACQQPKPVFKPQPTPTHQDVVVALCAAPFFVAGALALFFFTLWIITGGPFK